jgi:thiamine biosynthesis protein ThiI
VEEFREDYRTILYKVYMVLISNKIAEDNKYDWLVMGNSLGQVASQTPKNMELIMQLSNIPILNPLLGMNKSEIIKLGKEFETYDMSICNGEDCCTMFLPKNPTLAASIAYINYVIKTIGDYTSLVDIDIIFV